MEETENETLGMTKPFFVGTSVWTCVDTTDCATVCVLIFPRAPDLCSLLCQGFLAKIRICLLSWLQSGVSFVWRKLCGCWGKASWVLSPSQDILSPSLWYNIKTTYYTTAPALLFKLVLLMRQLLHIPLFLPMLLFSFSVSSCQCHMVGGEIQNTHTSYKICWWNDSVSET